MGRDVLTKKVLFSESVWNRVVFHCKKSGKGFKYTCLERGSCLSGKWVVNYLSLEQGYDKLIFVYNGVYVHLTFAWKGSQSCLERVGVLGTPLPFWLVREPENFVSHTSGSNIA